MVVEVEGLSKAFGDTLLIDDLSFKLPPGGIVGVIGPNGAGKTTLFKMITGAEKPDGGAIRLGESVKLGYVDQSRDHLNDKKTVWEEISDGLDIMKLGDKREMPSRAYVSWFNFKGPDQQKKVGLLSGGERNRVHLAKMLKEGGNLLLLDEPTNDLDTETLSALEAALEDFAGCAVVISHDRFFLDRMATHILSFEGDSHVEWFEGNFQDYEEARNAAWATPPSSRTASSSSGSSGGKPRVSQVALKTLTSAIIPLLVAAISFSQARAQDAAAVAGTYCLVGVVEVGPRAFGYRPAGRFEYFLAYGAYDEKSERDLEVGERRGRARQSGLRQAPDVCLQAHAAGRRRHLRCHR